MLDLGENEEEERLHIFASSFPLTFQAFPGLGAMGLPIICRICLRLGGSMQGRGW